MLPFLLIIALAPNPAQTQTQCDLDYLYMIGDIAIPKVVDSEPMYFDDYSKVLTSEEADQEAHGRSKRAAVRDRSRIWPDNTIPYVIEPDFNDYYKVLLKRAMKTWEDATCIRFVPRTSEQDYINIRQGRRCCSYVGRQRRGAQKMALDPGCMQHGILLHEFGHVIGFWHEQNRPDRDDYIEVIKNYHHSVRYNFQKLNESQVSDYGVPYDYASIMHYGRTFFSTDGKSTTLNPLDETAEIGQRLQLSPLDILQANKLYMCQEDCSWTHNASESQGSIKSMNYPEPYPPKTDCISLIVAEEGQVIRLFFEQIDIEHHADCSYDYLEVRDGMLPSSPVLGKFCGDLPPRNFTSSGPAIWVKFHSDSSVSKSGFFALYTAFDESKATGVKINPCDLKTCAHSCIVLNDVAQCTCPSGLYLNDDGFTCRDLNECMHNNGGCSHICLNIHSSYTCMCPRGYVLGSNNRTCTDIDECSRGSECSQVCINTPGSYYCSCRPGYRLLNDYTTCEDRDECLEKNGGCQHDCRNLMGTHSCSCRTGYQLASDKTSCIDIDECLYSNGGCQQTCVNTVGRHRCDCLAGFLKTSQTTCEDIDECQVNKGGCEHGCINTPGSFHCTCQQGYTINTLSGECEDIDECEDGNNGGCQQRCTNSPASRQCSCHPGYEPYNATHCQDVDECLNWPCEGGCTNEDGGYSCYCHANYILHSDGHTCMLGFNNNLEEEDSLSYGNVLTNSLFDLGYPRVNDPDCGEMIQDGPGELTSPLYPHSYPPNTECAWLLTARYNEQIHLTFTKLDLERFTGCRYDSLRVYDGVTEKSPYLANLCGRMTSSQLTVSSSGPTMLLKFSSDAVISRPGFSATIDMTQESICGGRFSTSTSRSRELRWKTREELQCMWSITGQPDRNILLNFIRFKMLGGRVGYRGANCPLDESIEIYNTVEKKLLARYCRNSPPPKLFLAESSQVTIVARAMVALPNIDVLLLHSSTRMKST